MSRFVRADIDDHLYSLLPKRGAGLREMEAYADRHGIPIIGPAVARLLDFAVQVSGAKRIFEMGSAIGYSTIWLARADGPRMVYTSKQLFPVLLPLRDGVTPCRKL